ncbi:MAG: methyl-accepting chemotaxis protein [Deltaproteobacteria bacterium]|nr:methyl-accepting chemotaxis protein [Deltaproteobacteria bacterium]
MRRLDGARKEFEVRRDHWGRTLPAGELKESIARSSRLGADFLGVVHDEFLPALRRGDAAGRDAALARAGPLFDAHREAVVKLVHVAEVQSRADEAEAAAIIRSRSIGLAVLGLLALGAGIVAGLAALRRISTGLGELQSQAEGLSSAVLRGDLSRRASADTVPPEFRRMIDGVNGTVEAFVKPLQLTADYVARISRGDIPPRITDRYEGEFNAIKNNLNQCIDAVNLLVQDAQALSRAAVEGRLSTRADASKHQGDFQKVVAGVNATLDAVLAPIDEARKALTRLSERDLTARMQGSYQGDHAAIKEALNAAAGALHDALGQVAEAVEQVSSAAGQIASTSQAVASGASEQASSLEETHSSLESMSAQTRHAADNAQQANNLASETKRSAEDGAAAMEQMTGAMGKIRHSAEGTSAIIKDISEIAFQTNLLALNAAVEAARAGEAGRGFAVVAEEVRSLALRAKDAAVKTEELIKESVKQAGEGEAVAKLSNEKLVEIVGSAQKVSEIVAEMAASAKEQAQGIEQVNKAVGEMDKVTQQNAASSEESSSAAEELSSQSEELAAMVGSFKISRAGGQKKVALAASLRARRRSRLLRMRQVTRPRARRARLRAATLVPSGPGTAGGSGGQTPRDRKATRRVAGARRVA